MVKLLCKTVFLFGILMMSCLSLSAQKTYIVCVGLVNNDTGEKPLPCSERDVRGVADYFRKYNGSEIFMLIDKNATRDHILRVLKAEFAKAKKEDEIIFVYSGHGFDGGVSTYNLTKGEVIYCQEIQDIMKNSKAMRKCMFVMSCHSGSFTKKYGTSKNRRPINKNANIMLYVSSRANESSWELENAKYSFFIGNLLDALKGAADRNGDRLITARELFNYVNARVIEDTGGKQHPQMWGKFDHDMVVVKLR